RTSPPVGTESHLFTIALMVAQKLAEDRPHSTKSWSRLAGVPSAQIARMERQFLGWIGWDVGVKAEVYERWKA
ncbi:hypothetical protein BDK51DRAFT_8062, partial [Blyttiomyces helicus]